MKDVADTLEAIVRKQLTYVTTASDTRALTDDEWEAVAHMARVVRTLAVHAVVKDDAEQVPENVDILDLARALDALRTGKL